MFGRNLTFKFFRLEWQFFSCFEFFRRVCESCFLKVHTNFSGKKRHFENLFFIKIFRLEWKISRIPLKFPESLPELQSTYQLECFAGNFFEIFFITFGQGRKLFRQFSKFFWRGCQNINPKIQGFIFLKEIRTWRNCLLIFFQTWKTIVCKFCWSFSAGVVKTPSYTFNGIFWGKTSFMNKIWLSIFFSDIEQSLFGHFSIFFRQG